MPTKKFVWKDRDTAAQDLIQLVYHAPLFISQPALDVLAALHSDAVVSDLRTITLDAERDYWERVYALRALGNAPSVVVLPELETVAKQGVSNRQQLISQSAAAFDKPDELYTPSDMMAEIIVFTAKHPQNKDWLFELLDRADPFTVSMLLSEQLPFDMPQEMSLLLVHRLVALLETNPKLLNLFSIEQVYHYGKGDEKVEHYLKSHFQAILEQTVSASLTKYTRFELPLTILFEWPELRAAVLTLRPELEETLRQEESRCLAERIKFREKRQEDYSYKETRIWRELEILYARANNGENRAYWELYHKTYDDHLSIPVRAAATHFLGKLPDHPGTIEKLALLARRPGDTWEGYFSPIRFEASKALFELATPKAWEALVATFLACPTNVLQGFLWDWIESLTDRLSGVPNVPPIIEVGIENRWFKALLREADTGTHQ